MCGLAHLLRVNFNISYIVFKHSWDVDLWELVLAEDYQQAGLSTSSIPHYHQLLTDSSHLGGKHHVSVRNQNLH